MDITFQPDQMVPAGRYIVILRPVADVSGVIMPPGEIVPPQNIVNENGNGNGNGNGLNGLGAGEDMAPGEIPPVSPVPAGTVPPQNMQEENTNSNYMGGKRSKKQMKMTKKAKKGKKGTRKLSPYMKFAQEARPKILKENPNMKSDIIGVGRRIGEMWRALSDAEKARY